MRLRQRRWATFTRSESRPSRVQVASESGRVCPSLAESVRFCAMVWFSLSGPFASESAPRLGSGSHLIRRRKEVYEG